MAGRALVLGGGGVTSVAGSWASWPGSPRAVDLTGADLVVGTSAGSVVGTQIGRRTGRGHYLHQPTPPQSGRPG
jgi:NTE family protein